MIASGEKTIVVLEGDQTGQELLEEALRVLDPAVTGAPTRIGHTHTRPGTSFTSPPSA